MKFWTLLLLIAYFDINFSKVSSRYLLVEMEGGYKAKAGNSELKSQGAGKLLLVWSVSNYKSHNIDVISI